MRALLIVALAACGHQSPRATCGVGWAALSSSTERPSVAAPIDRRPFSYITSIRVAGVDDRLAATLSRRLQTRTGMMVSDAPIQDDLKRLWASGVISDARVEVEGDGSGVVFVVEPRATIRRVVVAGGDARMARRFRWLTGAQFEPSRIARMTAALELAYVREGRVDASIEARHATVRGGPPQIDVCIAANPGPRVTIGAVRFPGRKSLPEATLVAAFKGENKVNQIGGLYDVDAFERDRLYLLAEYWDHGYADVRVNDPRLTRRGRTLELVVPIDEGAVYRIGTIATSVPLTDRLDLVSGELFSRKRIADARMKLSDELHARDVDITTTLDKDRRIVDLTFTIHWRWSWDVLHHWRLPSR